MPRQPRDPDIASKLIAAAARLLAEEGRSALTARRLGAEVGSSSMSVYTYFGGMDELLVQVWREGFRRFAQALAEVRRTSDPVADLMVMALGYRRFALANPDLYAVMFDDARVAFIVERPADRAAGLDTFQPLVERVTSCATAGRWQFGDSATAAEVVWMGLHGFCALERAGSLPHMPRRPDDVFQALLLRTSMSFGDTEEAAHSSWQRARRRER